MAGYTREQIEAEKQRRAALKQEAVSQTFGEKALRYGVKGPLAGASESVGKISNLPLRALSMLPGVGDQFGQAAQTYQKDFDIKPELGLPEQRNLGDMISQLGPEMIASMFIPAANLGKVGQFVEKAPKIGKYLSAILSQSLPQAGFAGAMSDQGNALEEGAIAGGMQAPFAAISQAALSPKPEYQKLFSILGGMLAGGTAGYGLDQMGMPGAVSGTGAAIAGALGSKGLGTRGMMIDELTKGIDMQKAIPRLEAADRLGLSHLTPSEAGRSPKLGATEGAYGKTEEGSVLKLEKEGKRLASEEESINKFLDELYEPVKMKPEIDKGYAQLEGYKVPDTFYKKMTDNAVFKSAEKELFSDRDGIWDEVIKKLPHHKEPAFDKNGQMIVDPKTGNPVLKEVPSKDNVAYFDAVKKVIDSKMDKPENLSGVRKAVLEDAKHGLLKELDKMHPGYKDVRYLSERQLTREGLEKVFDKKDIRSGANFYKALNSDKQFKEIMHNLRNLPELQSKLTDMKDLFRDFANPEGLKGAKFKASKGLDQQRDFTKAAMTALENMFTKGKFDKQGIDFMTSPDWAKQMADINKISDKQKRLAKIVEVLGKPVSQAARKPYDYEIETQAGIHRGNRQ